MKKELVATGGTTGEGGTGSGATVGSGGTSEIAGNGGMGGEPHCRTNQQCLDENLEPSICRNGECVKLINNDAQCTHVIPSDNAMELLGSSSPLIVGAFSSMTEATWHNSVSVLNWELGLTEFNESTLGGLPGVRGGAQRPLLAVVCQGKAALTDKTKVEAGMAHLVNNVGVSSVLTSLTPDLLYAAWNWTQAQLPPASVFFMDATVADLQLADMDDGGLMWHMLGSPRVLAPTVVSLVEGLEKYLGQVRLDLYNANPTTIENPAGTPLRVTLICSDERISSDVCRALTSGNAKYPDNQLQFNGATAVDAANLPYFNQAAVTSSITTTNPDPSDAVTKIQAMCPHVVVAMTTREFPSKILPTIEGSTWWNTNCPGKPLPFYITSTYLTPAADLTGAASTFALSASAQGGPLGSRLLGYNYAVSQDAHAQVLLNSYVSRLSTKYPGYTMAVAGYENFYDAVYFLLYSIAASNSQYPTADDIQSVLKTRVIGGSELVDIGPDAIRDGSVTSLINNVASYKMKLYGTMGLPDFDTASGSRITQTSIWCLSQLSSVSWGFKSDGLIYDPVNHKFVPPLAGTASCFSSYEPYLE